ncbi:MAG: hypothetical protein RBS43_05725, partial [Candidatus Cloacimonas sp.]|nr:hypothetical protein [Candidatus Cloacimonas sp.]
MPFRLLIILLLLLIAPLQGLTVGKISFSGTAALDNAALAKLGSNIIGKDYNPEAVTELTAQFYAYLNASGQYFYHIPAPELIPING